MIADIYLWLTAALPLGCAGAAGLAQIGGWSARGRTFMAISGILGGSLSATLLTTLLLLSPEGTDSKIQTSRFTWFSYRQPQTIRVDFGLMATPLLAGLSAAVGVVLILFLWQTRRHHVGGTLDTMAGTLCGLQAAATVFLLAPTLAQAFVGWAAFSLITRHLISLFRFDLEPAAATSAFQWDDSPAPPAVRIADAIQHRFLQPIQHAAKDWPEWLSEQLEAIESASSQTRVCCAVLFSSVLLLTWLNLQ